MEVPDLNWMATLAAYFKTDTKAFIEGEDTSSFTLTYLSDAVKGEGGSEPTKVNAAGASVAVVVAWLWL